ncbi:MAG: acyloxyacyl hydrolase [Acidobacteriota bacterium]|nr:acyloxyacyl hydrolase [Acidobacteriota bacterium]
MLENLRLAAGSLFLILTVLFFTVAAQQQQSNNLLKTTAAAATAAEKDLKNESDSIESIQTPFEPEIYSAKETSFFKPGKFEFNPSKPAKADTETVQNNYLYKHRRGAIEYNFEFGVAPFRPSKFAGPDEYDRSRRKMTTLDIRIGRTLGTKKGVTYAYLFGITPLVVAFKNEVRNPAFVSATATPTVSPTVRETSYGFGISPANFRFTFMPNRRIKPFLKLGAGALYFNKPIPVPVAGRYHFMGDWGGGLMIHSRKNPKRFLSLGYRYFHISNANIYGKKNNPGYNANTLYIGFSVFK